MAATCQNQVRLRPRVTPNQTLHSSKITVSPEPEVTHEFVDYFGNAVQNFSVVEAHNELTIDAESIVTVRPVTLADPVRTPAWEVVRDAVQAATGDALEAFEFACDSPFIVTNAELAAFARESFVEARPMVEAALDLSSRIHREFEYLPQSTTIDTPIAEVLRRKHGVCQDFAHLAIGALRSIGLAARYVSGYLRSGANLTGAEASHAWISVWCPSSGWIDIDPTNDLAPSDGHVTVAWGRDYGDVTPVKGVTLGGGQHQITVAVRVVPAPETGGPTA
jgi:transglutaminase-like putative cysteine protease